MTIGKGIYFKDTGEAFKKRLAQIKQLQALTLPQKIAASLQIIDNAMKTEGPQCVLFSGGHDSSVLLHLIASRNNPAIFAMYNDTGLAAPYVLQHVKDTASRLGVHLIVTEPRDPFEMWKKKGYFPIFGKLDCNKTARHYGIKASPTQCCYQLKEAPANKAMKEKGVKVVYWGNRAGESDRRKMGLADNGLFFKPKKYDWSQCYPLAFWLDCDIKKYIADNLPWYPNYNNFDCGCLCCAADIAWYPNNLSRLLVQDKETFKKAMLSGMGEQIAKANGYNLTADGLRAMIDNEPQRLTIIKGLTRRGKQ